MKRVHTVEFEDFDWFPSELRAPMTDLLVVLSRWAGVTGVLTDLVEHALEQAGEDAIVDLGSGSGGVMPEVLKRLRKRDTFGHVTLTLTDIFPSSEARERFNRSDESIRYEAAPVDASRIGEAPPGLRTMCNSFHHMRPRQARTILESAFETRQPLLIYEMVPNRIPFPLWAAQLPIGLPLLALLSMGLTPFTRPVTARQLLLTYGVPLIPALFAWDGQNSVPRIYRDSDITTLLGGLSDDGYQWEVGPAIGRDGHRIGNYIFGCAR